MKIRVAGTSIPVLSLHCKAMKIRPGRGKIDSSTKLVLQTVTAGACDGREDVDAAAARLFALPAGPLPLASAVLLCQASDGYLTAAAQTAFLEQYGGVVVAATAPALAADFRAALGRNNGPPSPAPSRGRGRCGRGRGRRRGRAGDAQSPAGVTTQEHEEYSQHVDVAVLPEEAWATLDGVDLNTELRRPVPTLQDVPPFTRAAVRRALVAALTRIREASNPAGLPACRARRLFCWRLAYCSLGRTRGEHRDVTCCWRGVGLLSKATGCACCGPRRMRMVAQSRPAQACARVRVESCPGHMLTAAELFFWETTPRGAR